MGVTRLLLERIPGNRPTIEARRCACLKSPHRKVRRIKSFSEADSRRISVASGGGPLVSPYDHSIQKRARGQYNGAGSQ